MRHIFASFLTAVFFFSSALAADRKASVVSFEETVAAIASIEGRIAEIDLRVAEIRRSGDRLAADPEVVGLTAERIRLEKSLKELKKKLPKKPLEPAEFREARKRLEKQDERSEKTAQERAKSVKKVAEARSKARRDQEKAYARANISGCPPGSVEVSREATGPTFGQYKVRINILNNDPENWVEEIRDEHNAHTVVRNLCPGGKMSIIKMMPAMVDAYSIPVAYTAYGKMVNGRRLVARSPTTSLYLTFGGLQGQEQVLTWDICFGTVPCRGR